MGRSESLIKENPSTSLIRVEQSGIEELITDFPLSDSKSAPLLNVFIVQFIEFDTNQIYYDCSCQRLFTRQYENTSRLYDIGLRIVIIAPLLKVPRGLISQRT